MTAWRFDQGRLDYFQFDEVKKMAKGLLQINGAPKPTVEDDYLRSSLGNWSDRPFAPGGYTVWRNYKRVFGCLLLATEIDGKIICTELCNQLANDSEIDADEYLSNFSRRFYYPAPMFEGYVSQGAQVFPVVAIIKFLIARFLNYGESSVSAEDVGCFLISNNVTGMESINQLSELAPRTFTDDVRQVRELMRFVSQFSFLKWRENRLFLDVSDKNEIRLLEHALSAVVNERHVDRHAELLRLGVATDGSELAGITISATSEIETEFVEGKRVRVMHLRTERSAKLKEFYFISNSSPNVCNMCQMDTSLRYPWVQRVIELHHLLPLSSPLRVDSATTSLADIVGLCPTCHRATHRYYSNWFRRNGANDFSSYDQARGVYGEARTRVVLV